MSTNHYFEEIGMWPRDENSKLAAYSTGFALSLLLTALAYYVTVEHIFSAKLVVAAIITLAIVQFAVQLIFFMHMNLRKSSRALQLVLACAMLIALMMFAGSIWIMNSLSMRMTPESEMQYMHDQGGM